MSFLLPYLLKAGVTLAGLYLVFWLFLRKDTFHQLKRFILLGNLVFSLVLPFIDVSGWQTIPAQTTVVYTPIIHMAYYQMLLQQLQSQDTPAGFGPEILQYAWYVYWAGVVALMLRFGIQLASVCRIIRQASKAQYGSYILYFHKKAKSPFSFFQYIVVHPDAYQSPLFPQILKHEQVHVKQKHSLDILLAELYTIFFWINPFAWLHKNLVKLNLEYIADEAVLYAGIPVADYQMNLVKLMFPESAYGLTTHFNQSSILTRIYMMNKSHSPARFRLKYMILLPLLTGFVLLFNATQAKKAENQIELLSQSSPIQAEQAIDKEPLPVIGQENPLEPLQQRISRPAVRRVITGIVKDAYNDKPITHGVVVSVKGKTTTTLSDKEGKFAIEVSKEDKVLVFQYVGYNTTEMAITSQNEMIVLLTLAEKPAFTSSYTHLSADTVRIHMKNMTDGYGGNSKITGRYIEVQDSTSLTDDSILYIIDGEKADKVQVKKLAIEKIASVTVYKDQLSLRKYDAADKKGVVEIELKK